MGHAYFNQKKRHKGLAIAFLSLMLIYFMFHLFVSERSIPNLLSLSAQQIKLQNQLASLDVEKAHISDHVMRLRPDNLDIDLVQDYTIRMLGHSTSSGIIVMNEQRG